MKTIGKIPGKFASLAIASLLITFLFYPAAIMAASNPQEGPESKAVDPGNVVEVLVLGKKIEKIITVGELHSYTLKLKSGQSAEIQIERQGVAVTATVFAPGGRKTGTFGSMASNSGAQQVKILAESAGEYRIAVRALFKPVPPGKYLIRLEGVHEASNDDLARQAMQSCEEKPWRDRENNFLVNEALGAISRCMEAVAHRLEKDSPQVAKSAGRARGDLDYLISRWHWGEFVSEAYRENLVGDFRMLAYAAEEPDIKKASAIINGVVEDLQIKADHCRKSNRGLGKDVEVSVRTVRKRDNKEEGGLLVYYKLGIYEYNSKSKLTERFDRLSSPAKGSLPASKYLIWAVKPGGPESQRNTPERLNVGSGHEKKEFDLMLD